MLNVIGGAIFQVLYKICHMAYYEVKIPLWNPKGNHLINACFKTQRMENEMNNYH